jgi:hypothetical protein
MLSQFIENQLIHIQGVTFEIKPKNPWTLLI